MLRAFVVLVAAVAMVAVFRVPASAMTWEGGSLAEAEARAQASHRWVLVDLFATWCGPCHEMDEKVYSRDEVARAIDASFVTVRRDGEKGEGEEIVKRYHVVGYPTVLVLDEKGVEVDRLMGFVQPRELISTLAQFRAGKNTVAELEHRLLAAPADEALRLEVGTRHAMRGDPRAVTELNAVVMADPDNQNKRAAAALLTLGKYYYLRGEKDDAQAERTLRAVQKRFPSTDEAGQVGYNLALALHHLKRDPEARKVLDDWVAGAPKDSSRYNAFAWLCFKNQFAEARGIEVAKKGLELAPQEHGLWDTLAELYAATGKLSEARDAESQALKIKPDDSYYQAQLRRFQQGSAK